MKISFKFLFITFVIIQLNGFLYSSNTSARFLKITSSSKISAMADAGSAVFGGDIGYAEKNPASLSWRIFEEIEENLDSADEQAYYEILKTRRLKITIFKDNEKVYDLNFVRFLSFELDSTNIKPEYSKRFEYLANYLKSNQNVDVLIEGFTDEKMGDSEYNRILTAKRAVAVMEYLISLGVSKDIFSIIENQDEEMTILDKKKLRKLKLSFEDETSKKGLIVQIVENNGLSHITDAFVSSDVVEMFDPDQIQTNRKENYAQNIASIKKKLSNKQGFNTRKPRPKLNEIIVGHNEWFEGIDSQYFGYSIIRSSFVVMGFSYKVLMIDDMKKRDSVGRNIGTFNAKDSVFNFTYSKGFNNRLGVGGTLKYITQEIDVHSDSTFAIDAGVVYRFNNIWTAGFSVNNFGDGIRVYNKKFDLPLTYIYGAGYHKNKWIVGFDYEIECNGDEFYKLGADYAVKENFHLRSGYNYSHQDYDYLGMTYGFGFVFFENLEVDYAYVPFSELEDTHRFTLKYKF